jgi:hypothetical protein
MQPFRVAFVVTCAAVAAANSLELELPNTALEDVPAGPRELHQRYSEIFRYGNRNAAFAPGAEIKLYGVERDEYDPFHTGRTCGRATSSTARP